MQNKIYIIGHKSPDLDSVVSAVSYANLKNALEKTEIYSPRVAGDINPVTDFVLDKFGFSKPEILTSAQGQKIILVDHNESSQMVDGVGEAEIAEVLDHHKVNFQYSEPIMFRSYPYGSTTSIIYEQYKQNNIDVSPGLAGLMLSAILDDTVITKSPTSTELDKKYIEELAQIAAVDDWKQYGIEMFKVKSSIKDMDSNEVIKLDFKDFEFSQGKFGIGQVETVDLAEARERAPEFLQELKRIKQEGGYHSVILFITDILEEGSLFLVATEDEARISQALGAELKDNQVYAPGIISRKKQVIPQMEEVFNQ
jgi:manganese-dependent inorganic pyrophosphatase